MVTRAQLAAVAAEFRRLADKQNAIIAGENSKGIYSNDFAFLKAARIYRECADAVERLAQPPVTAPAAMPLVEQCGTCRWVTPLKRSMLHPPGPEKLVCTNNTPVFGPGTVAPTFDRCVPKDFGCRLWRPAPAAPVAVQAGEPTGTNRFGLCYVTEPRPTEGR